MNAGDDMRDLEAREAKAMEWLYEEAEGFSGEREVAFARWQTADPRNAAAVARVKQTLALLEELPEMRLPIEAKYGGRDERTSEAQALFASPTTSTPDRRAWLSPAWAIGLAAVVSLAALGGWGLQRQRGGERFTTVAAVQQRVPLQDGSVVDLNGGSEVRVTFSATQRAVTLGAGEAHFEVAPDPARPFVVTAGGVSVRAIGTAFNVRLVGDAVEVVVTEGKVEVLRTDAPAETAAPARVVAGERVRLERDERVTAVPVERVEPSAMRSLLAWQNGITSFSDVPLRELVARFNRRNPTQLILTDAALGERKLGGVFALDQVDVFVRLLEQQGEIVAERRGEFEIVLRPAR